MPPPKKCGAAFFFGNPLLSPPPKGPHPKGPPWAKGGSKRPADPRGKPFWEARPYWETRYSGETLGGHPKWRRPPQGAQKVFRKRFAPTRALWAPPPLRRGPPEVKNFPPRQRARPFKGPVGAPKRRFFLGEEPPSPGVLFSQRGGTPGNFPGGILCLSPGGWTPRRLWALFWLPGEFNNLGGAPGAQEGPTPFAF